MSQQGAMQKALRHLKGLPQDVLGLSSLAGERADSIGSNAWVVSGSRTISGKPILVNDPHLGSGSPPGLLQAHQQDSTIAVQLDGDDIPPVNAGGLPGLGGNHHLSPAVNRGTHRSSIM